MKTLSAISAAVCACLAVYSEDVVIGRLPALSWTGGGTERVVSFSSAGWWEGLGLASVWPMDEGSGAAIDDPIAGYDGTVQGSGVWSSADGVPALYFDGNGDYVLVGDRYNIETNDILVGGWFWRYNNGTSAANMIGRNFSVTATKAGYGVLFYANSLRINGLVRGDSAQSSSLNSNVPTNEWTFSCVFVDRNTDSGTVQSTLFANGVFSSAGIAQAATEPMTNASPFLIGKAADDRYIKGWARDCFVKLHAASNDAVTVFNATRARYGK